MMRLGGGVQNRPRADRCNAFFNRLREMCGQGQRQRAEVSFIAAAGESAIKRFVPADALTNPAHRLFFNLGSKLGTRQSRKLRIQRCYQRLRQHCHVCGRGIHQAKIVGAGNVEPFRDHLAANVVENFGGVFAELRQTVGEIGKRALLQRELDWPVGQAGEIFVDAVNQLVAQPAASFGIEVKARHFSSAVCSVGSSCCVCGLSSGNKITSRIERESVSSMVSRSMPMPSPPVGGRP